MIHSMKEVYWWCSNCRSGGNEPRLNRRCIRKRAKYHGKKTGHRTNLVVDGLVERVTEREPQGVRA